MCIHKNLSSPPRLSPFKDKDDTLKPSVTEADAAWGVDAEVKRSPSGLTPGSPLAQAWRAWRRRLGWVRPWGCSRSWWNLLGAKQQSWGEPLRPGSWARQSPHWPLLREASQGGGW